MTQNAASAEAQPAWAIARLWRVIACFAAPDNDPLSAIGVHYALHLSFERPPTRVRNHHANDLDGLAVNLDALAYYRFGYAFVNEASEHLGLEPVGKHELTVGDAVRIYGEQFQCTALFPRQATFWMYHWQPSPSVSLPGEPCQQMDGGLPIVRRAY